MDTNEKALGQRQTAYLEDCGFHEIKAAIVSGIENGLSAQQITEGLRPVYKAIGPLPGLKYSRVDELVLQALEEFAKDRGMPRRRSG